MLAKLYWHNCNTNFKMSQRLPWFTKSIIQALWPQRICNIVFKFETLTDADEAKMPCFLGSAYSAISMRFLYLCVSEIGRHTHFLRRRCRGPWRRNAWTRERHPCSRPGVAGTWLPVFRRKPPANATIRLDTGRWHQTGLFRRPTVTAKLPSRVNLPSF